jgi:ribosomal protein S18 acetylase RimI-like enzyme
MEKVTIRPARDDDLETVKQIAVEAWDTIYQSLRSSMGDELFLAMHSDWRTEKAEQVARHYRNYPETTLVGFITYNLFERKKLGIIGNNAIHPKYQGRGLGTKQYLRVLEIFRKNGMLYAEVTTGSDESHARARAAYEKVGFKPVSRSVRYCREL